MYTSLSLDYVFKHIAKWRSRCSRAGLLTLGLFVHSRQYKLCCAADDKLSSALSVLYVYKFFYFLARLFVGLAYSILYPPIFKILYIQLSRFVSLQLFYFFISWPEPTAGSNSPLSRKNILNMRNILMCARSGQVTSTIPSILCHCVPKHIISSVPYVRIISMGIESAHYYKRAFNLHIG